MQKYRILKRLFFILLIAISCEALSLPSKAFCAEGQDIQAAPGPTRAETGAGPPKNEITIGCPVDNCPLLFQDDQTGEIKGITIDILDKVADATGSVFHYQALPSGNIRYEDLKRLQIDVVASVECNEINEHSTGILMTIPYLQTEKVFVCKKGVIFDPDSDMVIAVNSGSQTLAKIIQKEYPGFQVDFYHSTEDALSALLSGRADAVLQNQYSLERILAKPLYEDLQIVASATVGDSHCLASIVEIGEDGQSIVTDETARLISVLNEGIESLDKRDVSFFIIKETAENTYKLTLMDLLYRYRYPMIVIVFSACLILLLFWRNRVLQSKRSEQLIAEQRARELAAINENMHKQQLLLEDALDRAEAGNRAKTSFLFNMSHDIRTPMNAIIGFTTIARDNLDDREKLTDSLKKIQDSGDHLLQLIDDILDMSKIESGKVTLTEDICDLIDIIQKVRDTFQTELDKKGLTIQTDVSGVKNRWVYCDELRMNQILFNLLSNAVKFSKEGGSITIGLYQEQSSAKEYAAYDLRIQDTGIGISPGFLPHIFEPFERERSSTVSRTQGTGLGMAITKKLTELMGGTIDVHSQTDEGTQFILHFTFKIREAPQKKKTAEEQALLAPDLSGKRLLLVEDNELNREIAQEILSQAGFVIETAEHGQIAVEMMQNAPSGYYDAILMDIQMPVMDGYEATRAIRKMEIKGATIPIIAVTANAFEEDKKQAFANGMDAHIPKPINMEVLYEALERLLAPDRNSAPANP